VKIAFELEGEGDHREVETIWAVPVAKGYRVDNIPFYVRGVAWGDVVHVTVEEDGQLRYEGIVDPSGHSTIRLWFSNAADVPNVRKSLREIGCGSELDLERLVAVDIPADVRYSDVLKFLDEKESVGILEYEEGCTGHEH
jgi:Domain of unknown function (DUF4265)